MPTIAKNLAQALHWTFQSKGSRCTSVMPVFDAETQKVCSIRKAGFFERFKVRFMSEPELAEHNQAISVGILAIHRKNVLDEIGGYVDKKIPFTNSAGKKQYSVLTTLPKHVVNQQLLNGAVLMRLRQLGLMNTSSIGTVSEASLDLKKVKKNADSALKELWKTSPATPIETSVAVQREVIGKKQSGWLVNSKLINAQGNPLAKTGSFSRIVEWGHEEAPKEFPAIYHNRIETFDKDGILIKGFIATMRLLERTPRDIKQGTATYQWIDENTQKATNVSLRLADLVPPPSNLIYQHTDGGMTVWELKKDHLTRDHGENARLRWYRTQYDSNHQIIYPKIENPVTGEQYESKFGSYPCQNPYVFRGIAPTPAKKIEFNEAVTVARSVSEEDCNVDEETPWIAVSKHKVKLGQQSHQQALLSNTYDRTYRDRVKVLQDRIKTELTKLKEQGIDQLSPDDHAKYVELKSIFDHINQVNQARSKKINSYSSAYHRIPKKELEALADVRYSEKVEAVAREIKITPEERKKFGKAHQGREFKPNPRMNTNFNATLKERFAMHNIVNKIDAVRVRLSAKITPEDAPEYHHLAEMLGVANLDGLLMNDQGELPEIAEEHLARYQVTLLAQEIDKTMDRAIEPFAENGEFKRLQASFDGYHKAVKDKSLDQVMLNRLRTQARIKSDNLIIELEQVKKDLMAYRQLGLSFTSTWPNLRDFLEEDGEFKDTPQFHPIRQINGWIDEVNANLDKVTDLQASLDVDDSLPTYITNAMVNSQVRTMTPPPYRHPPAYKAPVTEEKPKKSVQFNVSTETPKFVSNVVVVEAEVYPQIPEVVHVADDIDIPMIDREGKKMVAPLLPPKVREEQTYANLSVDSSSGIGSIGNSQTNDWDDDESLYEYDLVPEKV